MLSNQQIVSVLEYSIRPYDKARVCMKRSFQYEYVPGGTCTLSMRLPVTDRLRIRQSKNCVVRSAKIGDKFRFCNIDNTISFKLEILSISTDIDDDNMVGILFEITEV